MDKIDVQLLRLLSLDSSCTAQELTKHIHLSVAAINKRIAKLKAEGIIEQYTVKLDPQKIGKPVLAYVLLIVPQFSVSERLEELVALDPDIVECHAITGEYDYIIKVYGKDILDLEEKILNLKRNGVVSKSNTLFSVKESKQLVGPVPG